MKYLEWLFLFTIFFGCNKKEIYVNTPTDKLTVVECLEQAKLKGFIGEKGGVLKLRGSTNPDDDFIVTGWDLKPCHLKYGLGRESFPALIDPQYSPIVDVKDDYKDDSRMIIVVGKENTMVYPIKLLITHEVINETIDGNPIMIAYCVLANLGAVYTRIYCNKKFTFALSGYTYYEDNVWNGSDGFILWDRETESLWWPLIDKAVSGKMQNVELEKAIGWRETTWKNVKKMKNVLVLKSGQTMIKPTKWKTYPEVNCK